MTRNYRHPSDYDQHGYDERQERLSASEEGRAGFNEIATWRSCGAWGDDE